MKHLFSFVSCLCLWSVSSLCAELTPRILSPNITLLHSSAEEITLQWEITPQKNSNSSHDYRDILLLFVPGPIDSATHTLTSQHWQIVDTQFNPIQQGDDADAAAKAHNFFPRITLRELGTLAGCRLAALSLYVQTPIYTNPEMTTAENSRTYLWLDRGQIQIKFCQSDPLPFLDFPSAIDPIARTLVLNYPPLRRVTETKPPAFPDYLAQPGFKLSTLESGVLTVPAASIVAQATSPLPVESLAFTHNHRSLPVLVLDASGAPRSKGPLAPNDQLRFYLPPSTSPFSPENVVWITAASNPRPTLPNLTPAATAIQPATMTQILLLEENHKFIEYQDVNDPNAAYWMWHEFVEEGTKTIELGFPPQIQAATIPLTLTLGYQPDYFSVTPETVWFQFDGHPVPVSIASARDNLARATAELCPAWITPGTHEIQLYFPDGKSAPAHNQKTYLDAIELAVPCSIVAGTQPYQVDSHQATLSPPPGTDQVWYVPTPSDLSTTAYWAPAAAATYSIPGGTASGQVYYLPAAAPIATVTVETISAPVTRTFDPLDTRQTDLILIAPRAWLSALRPYQNAVENNGTACRVVAVEDLYDYFGEGRLSPHAIKAFLRFAASQWQRPWPSYCILVGDATWDYWNRFGLGLKNYVPSYHEEKEYAVESWYVRLDEGTDDVPDMIVGRWPMQSQEGLLTLIQKTLLYQQNPTPGAWWNTLFVLTDDGFENYTDELLAQWIPSGFRQIRRHIKDYPLVDNIYLPEPLRRTMRAKTSLEATTDVIKIINDGVFLWEFFGHGAPNVLGEERMFFGGGSKYSEVKKLINQKKLPFLWAFTCETAKFDYAQEKWNISIGEDLLTHPDGGVITLLGATGRGYPREHLLLAQGLHKAAFDYKFKTQGQIFLAALLMGITESSFFEPLKQFALLGDPTLRFPEFQSIPGTLTPSDKGWTYQWDIASPLPALTTWEQGERDPLAASPVPPSATSIVLGHLPRDKRDTITRVGVDSVQIKESQVTIAQGALPLPEFKEAEAFIAPTTGVLPDLSFVPGSLTVQPQSPFSGQTVFLEAKVRNTGQASARNISIAGYDGIPQRNTMPLHAEVGERNRRLAYLHPGQVAPIRLRWDPTDNEGNHTLVLEIDTSKSIEEEDETNNQIETSLYVRKKADLIVNATKVNLIPIENGRQSQLQFEIFNQGESFAERITIELALKLAGQDQDSTIIIPRLISLQAGETYNAAGIRLKTPLDQIERLTITIDPDEIVDEESHANNQYIYVKP